MKSDTVAENLTGKIGNTSSLNTNSFEVKSDQINDLSKLSQTEIHHENDNYETDDYVTDYPERMQLNPSAVDYDENDYEDDEDQLELLPEARQLIQQLKDENYKVSSNLTTNKKQESLEEDMGFDEDDERIAIVVEKQRENMNIHSDFNNNNKEFINEEGSGDYNKKALKSNNNKLQSDYVQKYPETSYVESIKDDESNPREGSGIFANDDDDNDDDDDDTDESHDNREFFNSKHAKSNNRYFRKNTNDAIKIISTPLGKVGIVYQQTSTNSDNKKQDTPMDKKTSSFTDFDALSPDPESSHRLASSHPKITPVLTPDGKVALLYRGDSENSKYEPIRNLTHNFNNKNDVTDNKANGLVTAGKSTSEFQSSDSKTDESTNESEDDYDLDIGKEVSGEELSVNNKKLTDTESSAIIHSPSIGTPSSSGSFIIRPTDSILPMINRPLSEVLGIKKNQFKQFRVKDSSTSSSNVELEMRSHPSLSTDHSLDTTTLHFLTKVNLAEYPTPIKTRNLDFDFSRDNTMLDERPRHKDQLHHQQLSGTNDINTKINTIANDDVLSKTEVVNLAIIPHFDEEIDRLTRLREHETRRHYRQRYRQKQNEEDLSGIHCVMQAMMGIAAISTVFGMLGTFFKQRILDQIRLMHW